MRAHASYLDADHALSQARDETERAEICRTTWSPAYADICQLPAVTLRGLAVKLELLLDEHENGEGPHAEDLRKTVRRALRVINR